MIDELTGLYSKSYIDKMYETYRDSYLVTYIVICDFQKLKYINDNFGHEEGDRCIKVFAKLAKEEFADSIVARAGGDEFILLTHNSYSKITKKLEKLNSKIECMFNEHKIAYPFSFNSGIKSCEEDYEATKDKADKTMYYAKAHNEIYHNYEEKIIIKSEQDTKYIANIDKLIRDKSMTLTKEIIYDLKTHKQQIISLHGSDQKGNRLCAKDTYPLLFKNYRFRTIDWEVIQNILELKPHEGTNDKIMFNINYQTLLTRDTDFLHKLKASIKKTSAKARNLVVCVNIDNFENRLDELINSISGLRNLGFEVCLDNYDLDNSSVVLKLITNTDINYMKISHEFLLSTFETKKAEILAHHIIGSLLELDIVPIFNDVDSLEEQEKALKFSNQQGIKKLLYTKKQKDY